MNKELKEIMDQLTIPRSPTIKGSKFRLEDDKLEAKRLFKTLKARKKITLEDLTERGKQLLRLYYPYHYF